MTTPSRRPPVLRCLGWSLVHELVGVALQALQTAAHEERLSRVVVVLGLGQLLARLDGLLDRNERTLRAGGLRGGEGVLRQVALVPASPVHRDLVFLAQLAH